MMKRHRKIIIGILVFIMIFVAVGCSSSSKDSNIATNENENTKENNYNTETNKKDNATKSDSLTSEKSDNGSETVGSIVQDNPDVSENASIVPMISEITKGMEITFGSYEQDANLENGEEPIEWKVLTVKDGKALLLSKYAIDYGKYNYEPRSITWASSDVRDQLNGELYRSYFNKKEREIIETTVIDNKADAEYFILEEEGTKDKVFLLARDDLFNSEYGFSGSEEYDESRNCTATLYAMERYALELLGEEEYKNVGNDYIEKNKELSVSWWLRTVCSSSEKDYENNRAYNIFYVRHHGNVDKDSVNTRHLYCIRPALWLDIEGYLSLLKENCICVPEEDDSDMEVDISELKKAGKGSVVKFGSIEQDNDYVNGKEPIEWIVLENDGSKVLLLSKYVLDVRKYDNDDSASWEECSLRAWLNEMFYKKAFSRGEQSKILETELKNIDNPEFGTDGGNDTKDKIFILSFEDVTNPDYGFTSDKKEDISRVAAPTDYAVERAVESGIFMGLDENFKNKENSTWWLRTPGENSQSVADVELGGNIFSEGGYANHFCGIRPALYIDIS